MSASIGLTVITKTEKKRKYWEIAASADLFADTLYLLLLIPNLYYYKMYGLINDTEKLKQKVGLK